MTAGWANKLYHIDLLLQPTETLSAKSYKTQGHEEPQEQK